MVSASIRRPIDHLLDDGVEAPTSFSRYFVRQSAEEVLSLASSNLGAPKFINAPNRVPSRIAEHDDLQFLAFYPCVSITLKLVLQMQTSSPGRRFSVTEVKFMSISPDIPVRHKV